MKGSENMKVAKVIIIILDIIITPLLLIQIIGGNYNISGISVMLLSNIIIFTSKKGKKKDE